MMDSCVEPSPMLLMPHKTLPRKIGIRYPRRVNGVENSRPPPPPPSPPTHHVASHLVINFEPGPTRTRRARSPEGCEANRHMTRARKIMSTPSPALPCCRLGQVECPKFTPQRFLACVSRARPCHFSHVCCEILLNLSWVGFELHILDVNPGPRVS